MIQENASFSIKNYKLAAMTAWHGRSVRLIGFAIVVSGALTLTGCATMDSQQMQRMQSQIDAAMQQAKSAQQTADQAMSLAKKNDAEFKSMGGGGNSAQSYQRLGH